MNTANLQSSLAAHLPVLSSQDLGWENILVSQFQPPAGEALCHLADEHTICLSLAPCPVQLLHIKGGKTFTGLFGKGDIAITPADMPLFARWEQADDFLEVRIASRFIQQVARETLNNHSEQIELFADFRSRDSQLEAIAQLIFADLQQENVGGKLYIDSLTNVLAVHLLRQYTTAKPQIMEYQGGLPQPHLRKVLDYLNDRLDQNIQLADLAALLEMSQFHFGRLFKQSIGVSPYQYLLQQRIERAKQLLKQTDDSIVDIALNCGFNSHSHLSKQFRQMTGITPRNYRSRR